MARSPFQGTYQPNLRTTVVTAPDALVYINGEADVLGCSSCRRTFDLNKYITQIQVDLSVDSVPGSASISLSIPHHTLDDFYFDGNPIITPMMEVEIFAKGNYLLEGLPQYYPIFWGLITEVSSGYSGGENTVSLHCADILKWWELCKMNINPAFTAPSGQQGRSIFGNVFFGMNPYDVIWSLALQSYGDVLIGTGSLVSLYKEATQRPTFDAALSDLMLYWEQRFSKIRSNMVLYGTNGIAIRGDSLYSLYSTKNKGVPAQPFASQAVRNANGGPDGGQMVFDPSDPQVTAFRTQFSQAGQVNFWQSEYQTKLELANAAKEVAGFEFFMDPSGDIVFKPPFYNLDILSNKPVSWIQDIDIIDLDTSESEAEVVTQIVMQGSFGGGTEYGLGEETTPFTSVTDYHLLRKYGWRTQNYNSEFMSDPQLMFYHGLDVLDRMNSRRHRASVSIPIRPELRLGFPVYIAPLDQIWYVAGISHSISFGSRAQTTLTLTAKRSKFVAPKGVGSINLTGFKGETPAQGKPGKSNTLLSFPYTSRQLSKGGAFELKVGAAAQLPPNPDDIQPGKDNPYDPLILRHPKTGRLMGYPNVVMVYTRPFSPADKDLKKVAGQKTEANPNAAKQAQDKLKSIAQETATSIDKRFTANSTDALKDKHTTNRYQYGLNSAGVYVYAQDRSEGEKGVIGEILTLPSSNVVVKPDNPQNKLLRGRTSMIRPISDERGFEVIGHFRYGRRVALRDGRLVLTGNVNDRTNVDTQLALSGGLFETLTAQSQGLTTISSAYGNPAETVARLAPDDVQQTAVVNPDTKEAKFTDVGDNFVDAAPLGSPEQKGVPTSVEASQLSRALTLAELTVKEGLSDVKEDCGCILGRSDLAFINVGYQVKVLSPSSSATTSLFNSVPGSPTVVGSFGNIATAASIDAGRGASRPITVGEEQRLEENRRVLMAQRSDLQTQLQAAQSEFTKVDSTKQPDAYKAATQKMSNIEKRIQDLDVVLAENTTKQDDIKMNGESPAPSAKELLGRVDAYLTKLYQVLDEPHQELEKELRGEYIPITNSSSTTDFATPQTSEFAPPFSAPNRFALGDANAEVGATATDDIARTWRQFGDQLRSSSQRASLTQEISQDRQQLMRLQQEKSDLERQLSSQSSITTPGQSPSDRLREVQDQISRVSQDLANKQGQLNLLPPSAT